MAEDPAVAAAMRRVPAGRLTSWAAHCLTRAGVGVADAQTVAAALVQTSLWGIDSHGIARLGHYLSRIAAGSIAPVPVLRFTFTSPCTVQMDSGHGPGIVVCTPELA